VIEVPPPTLQDRIDILKGVCAKTGAIAIGETDIDQVGRIMQLLPDGSTGADIEYHIREAGMMAIRESMQNNSQFQENSVKITLDHLEKAIISGLAERVAH
jgi:SpoVK/Ycf46/Vps4 family AAA+-type ATPase